MKYNLDTGLIEQEPWILQPDEIEEQQSGLLQSYCITLDILNTHTLHKVFNGEGNKIYNTLNTDLQEKYLLFIFSTPLITKNIEYNYVFEFHPNITLKGGALKRHLHGTIFNITPETLIEIKMSWIKLLKVYSEKHKDICLKIVKCKYALGWKNYMVKDQPKWLHPDFLDDIDGWFANLIK